MALLIQFLLRLSFGLATGMAITSSKRVTSGYFRINLYVTLGLTTLAALLSISVESAVFILALGAGLISYVGSICWLYEKADWGKSLIIVVALSSALAGTIQMGIYDKLKVETGMIEQYFGSRTESRPADPIDVLAVLSRRDILSCISLLSSGLLLGTTMAAMLLGHWYLNSPTMELAPLKRLIIAMGVALCLQAVVSSLGLWGELATVSEVTTQWVLFVALRWLFGLIGVAALAWMAWQTLKVPNTQSATGILYVAVIGTFVGETMALLLSGESLFPL